MPASRVAGVDLGAITGTGGCEILYVTDVSVLAAGDRLRADARRHLGYASLRLLAALACVWLVRRPVVESRVSEAPGSG